MNARPPSSNGNGPCWLALDQGGSASRALVFDARGFELASARIEVPDHRPRPGWVEQDPEAVVASLRHVADAALAGLDADRNSLLAAGLSCQRSSLVCWDRTDGRALSPILSWQDTRAAQWLADQALDMAAIQAITGLYPNAHFGISKLRWCLDRLAPVQQAAADGRLVFGPLAAFLAHRLVQQRPAQVDPANASRTLLFDLARGDWHDGLLERFGIRRDWLPAIARSDGGYGDLALTSGPVPMRLLSGDQSTAAYAYGELAPDTLYLNVGTGAFVYRLAAEAPPALLRSVVHWDERPHYVAEGTVNGAGSALAWFAAQHGIADVGMALDAGWQPDASHDLVFLNGIGGLGSPDWRPEFASRFIGEGSVGQQLVAVAESVLFLIHRNVSRLQGVGEPCTQVLASGGVSRSEAFCQALSDLCGLPVRRAGHCEATARGAAFLLAGQPTDWARLAERRFEPRANPRLLTRHGRWQACMEAALAASTTEGKNENG